MPNGAFCSNIYKDLIMHGAVCVLIYVKTAAGHMQHTWTAAAGPVVYLTYFRVNLLVGLKSFSFRILDTFCVWICVIYYNERKHCF